MTKLEKFYKDKRTIGKKLRGFEDFYVKHLDDVPLAIIYNTSSCSSPAADDICHCYTYFTTEARARRYVIRMKAKFDKRIAEILSD